MYTLEAIKKVPGRLIELEKYPELGETASVDELAGVFLENRKTERLDQRINHYFLKFDDKGEPEFPYERESELGAAEYQGMMSLRELALDGYKYLVWLSPPGGRSDYTEGRLVVGAVRQAEGRVEIECRGVPVKESGGDMLALVWRLLDRGGVSMDGIEKAEDLREQAVGINLESEGELWQVAEEVFGMPYVWEAIREGEDVVLKETVMREVGEVLGEIKRRQPGRIESYGDSIRAGMLLEMMMGRRGYGIVGGNHGGLNSSLFEVASGGWRSPFAMLFGRAEIGMAAERKNGKLYCKCGERLEEGAGRCPKCGLRIKVTN